MPEQMLNTDPSMCSTDARAMHERTNERNELTNASKTGAEIVAVPNAPTPVDNPESHPPTTSAGTFSAADLAFAQFIGRCEANPWKVKQERFRPSRPVRRDQEYDRVTDYNLAFIRGQQAAGQDNGRTAA